MYVCPKNVFEPDPNPKIAPKDRKSAKNDPKFGQIKNTKIGMHFKTKIDSVQLKVAKCYLAWPKPKNSLKGPHQQSKGIKKVDCLHM